MNTQLSDRVDVERALGGAVSELAAALRGQARPAEAGASLAGTLAEHALTGSVRGCAVCLIDGAQAVRVVGVAGNTGHLAAGSVWELAPPLLDVLSDTNPIQRVEPSASALGQALGVDEDGELVATPLRIVDDAADHAGPLGVMLLVRDRPAPLAEEECAFIEDYSSLAALALHSSHHTGSQVASESMASFLNLVVHDLRAPLTVLSGYVDLLRAGTFGDGPKAWEKPLEMIAGKISETHRLVDDILLAARLESGAMPVSIETLDLGEVITRAAVRSEARAGLAAATIETKRSPQPVLAAADRFQVDRIVDNLINNAINYGGPSPWIRLSVDDAQPPAIRVEDRGVGISPELHSRIFDRFFRVDNRVPGTGFGLHVGRVLAEACGGSLRVESSVLGEGSVFRIELPAATTN